MIAGKMFSLEKAEIVHLEEIKEIERERGLSSWSMKDYRLEIDRQDSFFKICRFENRVAGFILARLIMKQNLYIDFEEEGNHKSNKWFSNAFQKKSADSENEAEIYNIGVKKKFEKRGIGTLLLLDLLEISHLNNVRKIWLEVRISNSSAIRFYESKGFKIAGIRKNLYSEPNEDGFVMSLEN